MRPLATDCLAAVALEMLCCLWRHKRSGCVDVCVCVWGGGHDGTFGLSLLVERGWQLWLLGDCKTVSPSLCLSRPYQARQQGSLCLISQHLTSQHLTTTFLVLHVA
jgi:hypothetical protein